MRYCSLIHLEKNKPMARNKNVRRIPYIARTSSFPVFAGADGGDLAEVTGLVKDIGTKFEKFKAGLDGKHAELDADFRKLAVQVEAVRDGGRSAAHSDGISAEDRVDFRNFCRAGIQASLSTQSNPDGGWLVPSTVDSAIAQIAKTLSPMRQYAKVVQGGVNYSKLVMVSGSATGWVSETGSRPQLSGPGLSKITPPYGELYTMPAVTQTLLDTASFDVAAELSSDIATQFAIQEGSSFVKGTGVSQPRGIATYNFVADASWSWGNVGYIATGGAALPAAPNGGDPLVAMVYSLKPQYRVNAVWGMNKNTITLVRQLKDSNGRYLWADGIAPGQPATLLGYPVVEFPDMDDVASNKYPIMFGDLNSAYLINDVTGTSLLRDPYSLKPYVLFYTTKRVGGGIIDFSAVKFLKMA